MIVRLNDDQPTVTVEAASSKHRWKVILPLHPELVVLVREWMRGGTGSAALSKNRAEEDLADDSVTHELVSRTDRQAHLLSGD